MMKLGSSKPWPDAMEAITGQREMDAGPLVEFFSPLTEWLTEQNAGEDVGWDDECSMPCQGTACPPSHASSLQSAAFIILVVQLMTNLF